MLLAEYDEKKTMEYIRREEREIGRKEGREEGLAEGEALLSELFKALLSDNRLDDVRLAFNRLSAAF